MNLLDLQDRFSYPQPAQAPVNLNILASLAHIHVQAIAEVSVNRPERTGPQTPCFGGSVVVLVNPGTISSGEGPAMGIARLPQGKVIGVHGTNGSFGTVGGAITMPGGYKIEYPFGRSVDKNGLFNSTAENGTGGVVPGLRVPKTLENVLACAAGSDVELQYAVRYLKGYQFLPTEAPQGAPLPWGAGNRLRTAA